MDNNGCFKFRVSEFDESSANHFASMDRISQLCGEDTAADGAVNDTEIHRFSSSVTFLREWRLFNYEPREVRFDAVHGVLNLRQFSSAVVPRNQKQCEDAVSPEPRDFVMYAGGPVWGLDWCPRARENLDSRGKCEFIAISAHPPGSCYHNLGASLSGRGLVQIWCVLNIKESEKDTAPPTEKPKRGQKKSVVAVEKVKKPRGRPRKNPVKGNVAELDGIGQHTQPLDIQIPEQSTQFAENLSSLLAIEGVPSCSREDPVEENVIEGIVCNDTNQLVVSLEQQSNGNSDISSADCSLPDDVALPRVVLCLAHNGKVVWDIKWRPLNEEDSKCKHRMGYLAVLLGNGSLEVWEVPLPHTIKALYSSSNGEGTDPRFVKLKPVFRCSMLKSGGVQSIPLTVEWSTAAPHNFLLAGCHDGTVAIWKFSAGVSSIDTRPLLCFCTDTVPIRAVSWAPVESDSEGGNVIATAGHEGFKFWDIRDPFRPLWDVHQASKTIYSMDWLADPRCLVLSCDDGTMKMVSITKAAYDVPVTGKPYSGTKQQGLHSYYGSSYAIWSVQVSRPTGMFAYCGADGTVVCSQITTKAVDKDLSRHRSPHFLCCSLAKDDTCIRIDTHVTGTSFPLNLLNGSREIRLSLREIVSESSPLEKADKDRAKRPASNDQTLALCYDDDYPEETLASLKKQKPSKSSSSCKKKLEDNLPLVLVDDESRSKDVKEDEKPSKYEVLPSKDLSMHRVRWNMNKGSERMLCYGGAAGIVRCQEIVLTELERKWAKKK